MKLSLPDIRIIGHSARLMGAGGLAKGSRSGRFDVFYPYSAMLRLPGCAILHRRVRSFSVAAQAANAAGALPPSAPTDAALTADGVPLAAHRAVYDLTLLKAVGSKSPTSARGRIAFDFTGSACDGYVQNFRQLTELQPAEGPTRISDMRSLTFEDGDGRSFTFKTQTQIDSEQTDEVDGRAQRPTQGPVSVNLAKPKPAKLDFDHDVLFPTEHLRYIFGRRQGRQKGSRSQGL